MARPRPNMATKKYRPEPGGGARERKSSKSFSIAKHVDNGRGKKIITYSKTGMGKTTLASMAPGNVFIGPDEGLDEDFVVPTTGERPDVIQGIETFQDIRDALHTPGLFDPHQTVSFDTLTYIQSPMCDDWVVANIKKEKGGKAESIQRYGYGAGYKHVYDQLSLLKTDIDECLIRKGKHVNLLCQLGKYEETDTQYGSFMMAKPDLYDKKNSPVTGMFIAWASYIFKIDWEVAEIDENKIATASDTRAIFVKPEMSFEAKYRGKVFDGYPVVPFEHDADNTLWRMLFDGYKPDQG